jgi:hypothetical protein
MCSAERPPNSEQKLALFAFATLPTELPPDPALSKYDVCPRNQSRTNSPCRRFAAGALLLSSRLLAVDGWVRFLPARWIRRAHAMPVLARRYMHEAGHSVLARPQRVSGSPRARGMSCVAPSSSAVRSRWTTLARLEPGLAGHPKPTARRGGARARA